MKKGLKRILPNLIFGLIFVVGIVIFLYPSVSNYINSKNQSRAISNYEDIVHNIPKEDYTKMWQEAYAYNEELAKKPLNFNLEGEDLDKYNSVLNVTGSGIMGYIEIENIAGRNRTLGRNIFSDGNQEYTCCTFGTQRASVLEAFFRPRSDDRW